MSVTLRMVGVMETGEPRAPGVPRDPRTVIRARKGETVKVRLTVKLSEGPLVDLAGGTVSMYVRERVSGAQPLARLSGTLVTGALGRADIDLPGTMTARWRAAALLYDVVFTTPGGDAFVVIAASPMYLGASPTLER